MGFRLYRRDYLTAAPDRPPLPGIEAFDAWYTFEGRTPTMSAIRHELDAQGGLIEGEENFTPELPRWFAIDAERIPWQTLNTADGWQVYPNAINGTLSIVSDKPVTGEVDPDQWQAFLAFMRVAAEAGGFLVG